VVGQVQNFIDDAPHYATDIRNFIERNKTLRDLQRKYDIGGQLEKKAAQLPAKVGNAASILADIGLGVVNSVLAVVTILILTAFMLAGGGQWREAALRLLPPEQARVWRGSAMRSLAQ
jgi:predicted PurR-regulated permease PerM